MTHGDGDPGLVEEEQWRRSDNLWYWSPEALVAAVRAPPNAPDQSVKSIGRRIADEHGITITGNIAPSPRAERTPPPLDRHHDTTDRGHAVLYRQEGA